jgi:F0F1-type ATP synthase membrane subunit c/vacuolar-type H+-ATPase subunit K
MTSMRSILLALAGLAAGIALALACDGDGSAADAADGGACDCPAAEPPLEGRIVRVTNSSEIAAQSIGAVGAGCDEGSLDGKDGILIGGSCMLEVPDHASDVNLNYSGISGQPGGGNTWACKWTSTIGTPNTMIATAICLVLPDQE